MHVFLCFSVTFQLFLIHSPECLFCSIFCLNRCFNHLLLYQIRSKHSDLYDLFMDIFIVLFVFPISNPF